MQVWVPGTPGHSANWEYTCSGGWPQASGRRTATENPFYLQTWRDTGSELQIIDNTSISFTGTPESFINSTSCKASIYNCLLGPVLSIVKLADGTLLSAFAGKATDSPNTCAPDVPKTDRHCYSLVFYNSHDDGRSWQYTSRLDKVPAMPSFSIGLVEPCLEVLEDGRVLVLMRLNGPTLWQAYSSTGGASWSVPTPTLPLVPGMPAPGAVWPQLLRLSTGALVVTSGRFQQTPHTLLGGSAGLGLWVSTDGAGSHWLYHDVVAAHNAHVQNVSDSFTNFTGTTGYTGLVEAHPGVLLLAYDRLAALNASSISSRGDFGQVWSVRINVTAGTDATIRNRVLAGAKTDDVSAAMAPLQVAMGNFSGEEIVDVTAFGARGDGHTDDTAAIQAALDAGVGKLVFFPHTGRSESRDAAYVISATLETSKDGPVAILGGSGTEESVFIIWNGPTNGTMLRWNSGWSRMAGVNLYSGSSLPGIILHIGYNPSQTAAVSIEDVEFEHCVFGGGEYFGGHNATALSGGGRIAGVKLGSFDLNGLDDDIATVKFRHCRFDTNYDGILFQSTNALNIDFDSCVWHKARNQFHNGLPGDHDVRSHVRMVRGGGASFTNPYFGCLGDAGLNDAALHIWSGWVSVTKAECESSTGGGGFLWLENNTVAVDPHSDPYNGKMNTTMRNIHEIMRPSVVTASRIDAKAIFGKGASIVLSPGSSPLVLVGNWMNYRDDAETSLPWVKIESGAATSFVTSIGNTFWTTRASPFDIQSEGRLISSGDMITADYGRTLTPLAAISTHMVTIRHSPYHIGSSFDDFQVDSSAGAANVTLPPARLNSGRKLTVTHTAGSHAVLLHPSLGDGIAGKASADMSAIHDSITLQSDGGQQWQMHSWSSPTPRVAGDKRWVQVAPGSFLPVWDALDLSAFSEQHSREKQSN
eukprot:COSAG01_NODE_1069_length_11875_cov_244.112716_4_plen_924_part_00